MKIIITESKRDRLVLNWLNKEFGNLTEIVKDGKIFYVDENGLPLFMYFQNKKNDYVIINYERIWVFFESIFSLKDPQIEDILKVWLEETYNLRGVTPEKHYWSLQSSWKRPIINKNPTDK